MACRGRCWRADPDTTDTLPNSSRRTRGCHDAHTFFKCFTSRPQPAEMTTAASNSVALPRISLRLNAVALPVVPRNGCGPHTHRVCGPQYSWVSGPAGANSRVGAAHVVSCGLHFLAVGVGLFVDDLEVATQLGDELLASHRTRATPEVTGSQHIAHDALVLGLQRRGLRTDQRAVGIHVAELVTDRHNVLLLQVSVGVLAGQDLLRALLLGLVVVGVADQTVAHPVQHVDDVAERGVHLAHGVVGGGLSSTAPTRTGDVLARGPHLAGLVLDGLGVHVETARHRPHLVRVSHETSRHYFLLAV